MLRPYDCGDLQSITVKKASPGTACVPKAKLASAARLMRVLRDPHPPCGHLPLGEGKKPLIRPAGTFPWGKVTNDASPLRLRRPSVSYCKKASPETACVPKAKLTSAARLMRVTRNPHPPCGHLPPGEGKKPLIRPTIAETFGQEPRSVCPHAPQVQGCFAKRVRPLVPARIR